MYCVGMDDVVVDVVVVAVSVTAAAAAERFCTVVGVTVFKKHYIQTPACVCPSVWVRVLCVYFGRSCSVFVISVDGYLLMTAMTMCGCRWLACFCVSNGPFETDDDLCILILILFGLHFGNV